MSEHNNTGGPGKGDVPRAVDPIKFGENFNRIFGGYEKPITRIECPDCKGEKGTFPAPTRQFLPCSGCKGWGTIKVPEIAPVREKQDR